MSKGLNNVGRGTCEMAFIPLFNYCFSFSKRFPTLLGFVKSVELISISGVGNSALRCEFTCEKLYGLVSRVQVHKLIKRENN